MNLDVTKMFEVIKKQYYVIHATCGVTCDGTSDNMSNNLMLSDDTDMALVIM